MINESKTVLSFSRTSSQPCQKSPVLADLDQYLDCLFGILDTGIRMSVSQTNERGV